MAAILIQRFVVIIALIETLQNVSIKLEGSIISILTAFL
jgi:hypothetical protein